MLKESGSKFKTRKHIKQQKGKTFMVVIKKKENGDTESQLALKKELTFNKGLHRGLIRQRWKQ